MTSGRGWPRHVGAYEPLALALLSTASVQTLGCEIHSEMFRRRRSTARPGHRPTCARRVQRESLLNVQSLSAPATSSADDHVVCVARCTAAKSTAPQFLSAPASSSACETVSCPHKRCGDSGCGRYNYTRVPCRRRRRAAGAFAASFGSGGDEQRGDPRSMSAQSSSAPASSSACTIAELPEPRRRRSASRSSPNAAAAGVVPVLSRDVPRLRAVDVREVLVGAGVNAGTTACPSGPRGAAASSRSNLLARSLSAPASSRWARLRVPAHRPRGSGVAPSLFGEVLVGAGSTRRARCVAVGARRQVQQRARRRCPCGP